MEQLKQKYADRDVAFLHMYVREPHAKERGLYNRFSQYENHTSYEHKVRYAQELVAKKQVTIPLMVDGFDQKWHKTLGNLPNMAYIVNKEGKVEYNATWQLADEIDEVLAEILTAEAPSRPMQKTISTKGLSTAI